MSLRQARTGLHMTQDAFGGKASLFEAGAGAKSAKLVKFMESNGRSGGIRTHDP